MGNTPGWVRPTAPVAKMDPPGGAYDRVSFVILLLWIAVLSGVLLRRPATASNAVQAPIPAA